MPPDDLQSAPGAPGEGAPDAPAAADDAAGPDLATGPAASGSTDPAAEAAAWAGVVRAWDDEAAHRAYLARFGDLEGLAIAGGRYRAVLEERPGDELARRFRDEVVKRATVAGLALMPRTRPPSALPRLVRLVAVGVVLGLVLTAALLLGGRLFHLFRETTP
jgi:hypothetical protein